MMMRERMEKDFINNYRLTWSLFLWLVTNRKRITSEEEFEGEAMAYVKTLSDEDLYEECASLHWERGNNCSEWTSLYYGVGPLNDPDAILRAIKQDEWVKYLRAEDLGIPGFTRPKDEH